MKHVHIGKLFERKPPRCFERYSPGGAYSAFMEFPTEDQERLQRSLLRRKERTPGLRLYLLILVAAVLLALVACGGGDEDQRATYGPVDCGAQPEVCV